MVIATPFLPRIYYLKPQLVAHVSELEQIVDRCSQMGFDHVLIPPPFDGDSASARQYVPADLFGAIAKLCATKRLKLLIDLDIAGVDAGSDLQKKHPGWFFRRDQHDDLPDPRHPIHQNARWAFRYDMPEMGDQILTFWQQSIKAWVDAGVTGFRCVALAKVPAYAWKNLIDQAKSDRDSIRFLAWTPGCTPAQIEALIDCRFDATFSSGAWWDYQSPWLAAEIERLSRVAPPIAFPESPDEPVLGRTDGLEEPQVKRLVYQRALRLASVAGNGILIPMGFESGCDGGQADRSNGIVDAERGFDLSNQIAQVNAFMAETGARFYSSPLKILNGADAKVAFVLRQAATKPERGNDVLLMVANAMVSHGCTVSVRQLQERAKGFVCDREVFPETEQVVQTTATSAGEYAAGSTATVSGLELGAAGTKLYFAHRPPPIIAPGGRGKQAATAAGRAPRIAIEKISPSIDGGRFPVKRIEGESVDVEADVFVDGHDKLAVALLWRATDQTEWQQVRMHPIGNDRWSASMPLLRIGRYQFAIEAWRDVFATYRDELEKKASAGLDVTLELEEGRILVQAAAEYAVEQDMQDAAATLKNIDKVLKPMQTRDKGKVAGRNAERVTALLSEPTADAMRQADARPFLLRSEPTLRIDVERSTARFASWYELFPRSQSGDPARHGTFDDVIKRLPAIRAMGFDTLYFPPIHPIGVKHRKGRNNSLTPAADDPGSPYAIGTAEGGHDAIHPQLGTLNDFRRLRDAAATNGLEIALDFAIQCSPDHPWLKQHPDWFDWRPDGSLRYAENPPKKYQDIVNVHFYGESVIPSLWIALRDVVLFWVKEGVRILRVDNPHTKPLPFWEWLIAEVRGRYPDTIFLSEAFTRPKMMYRLAKLGFTQSYTYFTWRHTKEEFIDYLTELTTTSVREYFRPHFFVNTPDINPYFLQQSGRPGFLIRAALAATLSGLWGMYSGFELCEATPLPGKEEYLDSEKFEIRARDWQHPGNIIQEITLLNRIRSENPALQTHLGVRFLPSSSEHVLYFMKATAPVDSCQSFGDNVVLVAINLDPRNTHESTIELPLQEFDLPLDGEIDIHDLVNGTRSTWRGTQQQVRLDPFICPFSIWRIRHSGGPR